MSSQAAIAAQVATVVLTQARPATSLAAPAEPALKPNQPNHRSAAPSITNGRLWGRMGSLPKPLRLPMISASTRPATPALMWTTVPPAKSIGATLAIPSVTP
ncbi:hypothetical protein D3C74_391140 [compost metagenome]